MSYGVLEGIDPQTKLPLVGYWKFGATGYVPQRQRHEAAEEVQALIVPGWNESEEAQAVIEFMKAGRTVHRWRGFACDRIDGEILGTTCMAHGNWQYPEKWWRYIEKHSVRPDNEKFIEDACNWWLDNNNDRTR